MLGSDAKLQRGGMDGYRQVWWEMHNSLTCLSTAVCIGTFRKW